MSGFSSFLFSTVGVDLANTLAKKDTTSAFTLGFLLSKKVITSSKISSRFVWKKITLFKDLRKIKS